MIKNDMSIAEFSDTVENFITYYNGFEQRLDDKSELEKAMTHISSKTAKAVIQKEIDAIQEEDNTLVEKHENLIQSAVEYVFRNEYRKGLLTIESYFDVNSFKNNNGGYDNVYSYMFSGKLGKPLYDLMTLCSWFEFYGDGHSIPKERQLTNQMSYEEFAKVVNACYVGQGSPLKV